MPINISPILPEQLLPIAGVSLGIAESGIKKPNHKDLLVIALDDGVKVAGVFTKNRFCAAPVIVAKQHLAENFIRALVINTGNANAGTGNSGWNMHSRLALLWLKDWVVKHSKYCLFRLASLWSHCPLKLSLMDCPQQ